MQQLVGYVWVEVYVEGFGWVGFDLFMNCCLDECYVCIVVGFDYCDVQLVMGFGVMVVGVEISVVQMLEFV